MIRRAIRPKIVLANVLVLVAVRVREYGDVSAVVDVVEYEKESEGALCLVMALVFILNPQRSLQPYTPVYAILWLQPLGKPRPAS